MFKDLAWFTQMKSDEEKRDPTRSITASHESVAVVHSSGGDDENDNDKDIWTHLADSPFHKPPGQQVIVAVTGVDIAVEETKSPAGISNEDQDTRNPQQTELAKMFLLYHAKGSVSALLSTLLVISLYSAIRTTKYLPLFGILASLHEFLSLASCALFVSSKTYINSFAVCSITGILGVIGWVVYLPSMVLITSDEQVLTSVIFAQIFIGVSSVQQILALDLVHLRSDSLPAVTDQKIDVLSTDLTHTFGRLYLGPILALLLSFAPDSTSTSMYVFNSLTAPGWLGLCIATLSLAAAFAPLNRFAYIGDASGLCLLCSSRSAKVDLQANFRDRLQQQQQQQQQHETITSSINSPRAARATKQSPSHAAFSPSSSISGQEVIVATGDFIFQFSYWGWLWGAHAWYAGAQGVQRYSSLDIYYPVVIGLLIGWIFPFRRLHDCLCFNLRCNPFSAEFTSCCLGCVFMICSFLLLATQRANEAPPQSFVICTGISAGLAGSLYFLGSDYLIVNLAFIRSRHTIAKRIRSYTMVAAAGRGTGILVLGSMISSQTGKIYNIYELSVFLAGLMLLTLAIVIVAATRKNHLTGSTSFRNNTLCRILETETFDENVAERVAMACKCTYTCLPVCRC